MLKKSILALFGCLMLLGISLAHAAIESSGAVLSVIQANTNRATMYFIPGSIVDIFSKNGSNALTIDKNAKISGNDIVTKITKGGIGITVSDEANYTIQTLSQGPIVIFKGSCALILLDDLGKVTQIIVIIGSVTFDGKTYLPVPGVVIPKIFRIGGNVIEPHFHGHHGGHVH